MLSLKWGHVVSICSSAHTCCVKVTAPCQCAVPVTAVELSPSSEGDVPHSLAPAHHWSGLVSRHSLKASNKGGLAMPPQPGPNAAFITNHGSNAFCLQKWEYISKKTTDLLEHLYEHQTLNPFSKMAEINPIQHDIRKVKKWNVTVKLVEVNLWPQKLTQIT